MINFGSISFNGYPCPATNFFIVQGGK